MNDTYWNAVLKFPSKTSLIESAYHNNFVWRLFFYGQLFVNIRAAIVNYVDIFIAPKTKINESFPTAQFAIDAFHKPLRLEVTDKSRGLLLYIRSYLPLRQLTKHKIFSDIQAFIFEINLKKKKWLFLSIYKPPSQNCQYFLDSLHNIIDFYSSIYDNHIVLGDFNTDPSHTQLSVFMEHYNYYNLIKSNNYFKGDGSCKDLILNNRKYCLKKNKFLWNWYKNLINTLDILLIPLIYMNFLIKRSANTAWYR